MNLTKTNDNFEYLRKPLIPLTSNEIDSFRVDDAVKGLCIFGGTGSGKTSASGRAFAKTYLKEGWGGLVLCAKSDEADLWRKYCKETNRETDLIIFSEASKFNSGQEIVFNPIDYERARISKGGGETQNITNIFMNIYRMGNRIAGEGDTKEERYWDTALKRCLNRTIDLIKLADEDLSYENMVEVISSAAKIKEDDFIETIVKVEDMDFDEWYEKERNYCLKCLASSYFKIQNSKNRTREEVNALNLVEDYFAKSFPGMSGRTKSVVVESFMGLAEPFLSGILHRHFSGKTNLNPEIIFTEGKIVVLDFPIKDYLDAGIIAQCVFKLIFQQAIERRRISEHPLPAFLWCDEAQYFINPYDQIFLTTARSSRAATVYLSQNISNFLAVIGSGSDAKARIDSLLGNLCTKIFHANTDAETNEYASRLIGASIQPLHSFGESHTKFAMQDNVNQNSSLQYLPQIQPRAFTTLKTGGYLNNFEVEAVINTSGVTWSNGKNYLKISIEQHFNKQP